ncbi:hypothetical protein HAX54_048951, partial [Datura stramonium]|nr:hypothetical protein [Datura stramonium]
ELNFGRWKPLGAPPLYLHSKAGYLSPTVMPEEGRFACANALEQCRVAHAGALGEGCLAHVPSLLPRRVRCCADGLAPR